MAQQALPEREARLGRAMGADASGAAPHAVVLLLPGGGVEHSARRRSAFAAAVVRPLARRLVRGAHHGEPDTSLVAHVVHYRYRGWNGEAAHPACDAEWAVEEVVKRYGDVPVCLVGIDVGARAALRAAGHPMVSSVLALSLWLPENDPDSPEREPVRQLLGRQVMFVHGTDDEHTDPELSYRLAERAKKANADVCRFEVHTDGHGLHQHNAEVRALAENFVLGTVCGRDFARPLVDAMAAPPPLGLRMPLATGFGQSLRR
ncbi:alpha/beta hydrolase [Streptomyces marispadix]|uniref:Alpha/beta hydrolase n=1 Tax=Streptomyces marispadix TaxID=2922868 RepID=A0ABS9T137_9ACTN|nr:alpha/beta hydrolase [Streptomyces marispadix]MCH6162219.1 alpha/beta hydrolase [Streptomyces marispadix]